jgi:hypothetical protein
MGNVSLPACWSLTFTWLALPCILPGLMFPPNIARLRDWIAAPEKLAPLLPSPSMRPPPFLSWICLAPSITRLVLGGCMQDKIDFVIYILGFISRNFSRYVPPRHFVGFPALLTSWLMNKLIFFSAWCLSDWESFTCPTNRKRCLPDVDLQWFEY